MTSIWVPQKRGKTIQGGLIVLWNVEAILAEGSGMAGNVRKELGRMESTACVNSLRWSRLGQALASGGDDGSVLLWQRSGSESVGEKEIWRSAGEIRMVFHAPSAWDILIERRLFPKIL